MINKNIMQVLKVFFMSAICCILFSCAGGDAKKESEPAPASVVKNFSDIDSDVVSDFEKAVVLLNGKQNEQAIDVLNSVIAREKRLPAPYVNIAIAYKEIGDVKAAEENLIHALMLEIGHPVANNELGLLYRKAGKFNAARTAYQNAIKDHPDYLPAKKNLGILCDLYLHDFECALQQFEDYLALSPDDKTMAIWIADVKNRLGK